VARPRQSSFLRRQGQWGVLAGQDVGEATGVVVVGMDVKRAPASWLQSTGHSSTQMSRRHFDANIIHLQPGSRIEAHAGPEFDVLLHILHGDGQLMTEVGTLALRPGELLWLPRLSRREIRAGEQGLTYLTVHSRRSGLTIQQAPQRT
jgi:quercetin dioxygenase-like cupin family protein